MKKKLILALSLVGVAALSIGGTLAYYTDSVKDSRTIYSENNVKVELLSDYSGNGNLLPSGYKKETNSVFNYRVKNVGETPAYVFLVQKTPVALLGETASTNILHTNYPGRNSYEYRNEPRYWVEGQTEAVPADQTWKVSAVDEYTETINGVEYNVSVLLYNSALEKDEETTVGINTIYLDSRLDKVDDKWVFVENGVAKEIDYNLSETFPFIVEAHAIQANEFTTVEDAYAAYVNQWGQYGKTARAVNEE